VSCPDWDELLSQRDAGERPPGWAAARRHLGGCPACRRAVQGRDPVLALALLSEAKLAPEETLRMRERVAGLRRVRRLEPGPGSRAARWGAAAVLTLLALAPLSGPRSTAPVPVSPPPTTADARAWRAEVSALPLVEEVESPYQQVVHWPSGNDLDVVWLVDRRLDG
jgi:hypothetical protein